MSTVKNIRGDYTIQSVGATDKININTSTMTVNGNLIVTGNSSSISSTNTSIWDNIVTLNGGLSPGLSPTLNAGIEIDRGNQSNVQLRWNETVKSWQINNIDTSEGNFANIATTGNTGGITMTANLDMQSYAIYSSTNGNVRFDDNVAILNTTVAPPAQAGYNILYTQTPAGGGSGPYVTNTTLAAQELATKSVAIKYSIIFG